MMAIPSSQNEAVSSSVRHRRPSESTEVPSVATSVALSDDDNTESSETSISENKTRLGELSKRDLDKPSSEINSASRKIDHKTNFIGQILPWSMLIVWPLMCLLPLLLTNESLPTHYSRVFPSKWYSLDTTAPKPLGLCLGILAVAVGHLHLVPLFYFYRKGLLHNGILPKSVQKSGPRDYFFLEGLKTHLSQPEGFVLLSLYLSLTWMLNLMPNSYYSFTGHIQWSRVFGCLLSQDGLQYIMHRLEHSISPTFYKKSHKPHHKFTNPRLFDAFDGSLPDTILMILVPLYATANIFRDCNVWTYMAFGSIYANWLVLIHSEYHFPWDTLFRKIGFGTPGDHHVHHKLFKYNYGHLFMYFDRMAGTYRNPSTYAPKLFNE